MYCPKCRAEFREGFTQCSDCRVPLVAKKPPERKGPGDPDLDWVMVLDGADRIVLATVKGLLEEASIPFYVLGDEIGPRLAMVDEFIHPWWRVHVGLDREEEARTILQQLEAIDPAGAENPEAR